MYTIEIKRTKTKVLTGKGKVDPRKFYWVLKGGNGEVMATSSMRKGKPKLTVERLASSFKQRATVKDLT